MRTKFLLLLIFTWSTIFSMNDSLPRTILTLDTGWLFTPDNNSSYSGVSIDESSFEKVCIPHPNVITKHAYQSESAFRFVSWYRRHFTVSEELKGKKFLLEFEGVSIVATVFVNGIKAGEHKGAYTPFTIDITPQILYGKDNVIAVQVDSRSQHSIPPEGGSIDYMIYGGIVRPVKMIIVEPLYVNWIFVFTENPSQKKPLSPTLNVKINVVNDLKVAKSCTVITTVIDKNNNIVAQGNGTFEFSPDGNTTIELTTTPISNPHLWSVDYPYLYYVVCQIFENNTLLDQYTTRTGIRSLTINKTDGKCYLNGEPVKLRGLNRHETYPYIGRAASERLQRKDADILKYELGCNVVRTSHYPQSPEFLNRCDEIGLLVLEEIPGWNYIGNEAWQQLEMLFLKDMIIRDRNHPCILSWGVRVNESADNNTFYKKMNDTAHTYDPTRLTFGVRKSNSDPKTSFLEDIWTRNFVLPNENPDNMPTITTEWCGHNLNPQAHSWDSDEIQLGQILDSKYGHAKGHNESYKISKWAGLLGWCAFDYASGYPTATTGETGRGKNSYVNPHGVSSIFRLPKLAAWFYQSQRDPSLYGPMVHICNYWTPQSPTNVVVVSNCEEVELFLNGKSQGRKTSGNLYTSLPHPLFSWNVNFSAGELKAVGYIGGKEAASHSVWTPGKPVALKVEPDTNVLFTGGDMTRVVVSLVDSFGQILHLSDDSISLSASGAGDFIGEEKTAFEGGQIAFYVKTRANETGNILCLANISNDLKGSATISVVKKEENNLKVIEAIKPLKFTKDKSYNRLLIINKNIYLPYKINTGSDVYIYDLRGKLLFKKAIEKESNCLLLENRTKGIKILEIKGLP